MIHYDPCTLTENIVEAEELQGFIVDATTENERYNIEQMFRMLSTIVKTFRVTADIAVPDSSLTSDSTDFAYNYKWDQAREIGQDGVGPVRFSAGIRSQTVTKGGLTLHHQNYAGTLIPAEDDNESFYGREYVTKKTDEEDASLYGFNRLIPTIWPNNILKGDPRSRNESVDLYIALDQPQQGLFHETRTRRRGRLLAFPGYLNLLFGLGAVEQAVDKKGKASGPRNYREQRAYGQVGPAAWGRDIPVQLKMLDKTFNLHTLVASPFTIGGKSYPRNIVIEATSYWTHGGFWDGRTGLRVEGPQAG